MKYQDFVINNGVMIGKFEEMYQVFDDPWEQSTREKFALEKQIALQLLKKNNHKSPIEIGCGHGHFTNEIHKSVGNATGVDISHSAIQKAKNLYPHCNFYCSDISDISTIKTADIDCIMLVEVTWYVLDKLEKFKKDISVFKNIGFFHSLMTYKSGQQQYGKNYFTNGDEIKEYFSDVIDITDFGEIGHKDYDGGKRTFFYGKIR